MKIKLLLPVVLFLSVTGYGQNVGVNTTTPQAALDINGDIITRSADLTVNDGITIGLDVNTTRFSYYRIAGPTADFTVAGIVAGIDGRLITLFNRSGFTMQLNNEDANAAPTDMIVTGTNTDIIIINKGMVSLQYDGTEQKWIVKSSNKFGGGGFNMGGWDTTASNIFFNTGNVGIGTEYPATKLTVQTGLNSDGISHVGGIDEIILKSSIGSNSALFGTSTNNIFSLTSGGIGKLHIWPNGAVVIGDDSGGPLRTAGVEDEPVSKLTIKTGTSTVGWEHIGTGAEEIIVNEHIGGVSSSIGTKSNHAFRLRSNDQSLFHLYPNGQMVAGPGGAPYTYGRLTIESVIGYGLTHTDGNIALGTYIGGFPETGWLGTISNHPLSFFTNNGGAQMTILPNGAVGIGTSSPSGKLQVKHGGSNAHLILEHPSANEYSRLLFTNTNVSRYWGIAARAGTGAIGNDAFSIYNVSTGFESMVINGNGYVYMPGQVGIGTINAEHKFAVNGTIRSKEVIVESAWADYVFSKDYKLRSLEELEKFIQSHQHLPNIPSAKEIEEKGLQLGDTQKRMMEKIEELTLYIIEQGKQIRALQSEIEKNNKSNSGNK
jgi:hypothetical protein